MFQNILALLFNLKFIYFAANFVYFLTQSLTLSYFKVMIIFSAGEDAVIQGQKLKTCTDDNLDPTMQQFFISL